MSNVTDKITNTASSYIGGAKQTIGETLGYPDLAASGAQQKTAADLAIKQAEAKAHVEGAGNKIEGRAQQVVGSVTGDSSLQARGHGNEALGDAQRNV